MKPRGHGRLLNQDTLSPTTLSLVSQLPTDFNAHPHGKKIIAEADIRPKAAGILTAKVLIFKTTADMRQFWIKALGKEDLGEECEGVVSALFTEYHLAKKGQPTRIRIEADRRYFCIIGLVKGHLGMECIAHEATHAGFAYARRANRKWSAAIGDFDEESVCYPAGRIAKQIVNFLQRNGFYDDQP